MGKKRYYMFSIEPALLLKMGFILHRTRANESEFPTYQRLLVPSRLKGITSFIDGGGYFPNSIILNFNTSKHKVQFESGGKKSSSKSVLGTLKIPNSYGIAYIIDGQHRVYGYANSSHKENNTIPVVAFDGLSTIEQLEIFMDINQNQKAVSPSLRLDLEEDLFWEADRADSRLKALRSSIIKSLSNSESSPLFNRISIGEDSALLTFKPFTAALINSGLLPIAKGNKYDDESLKSCLYNTNNHDHNKEMILSKKKIVDYIISCYNYVESNYKEIFDREKYFIISNRGTFAFISLIGSLNEHETNRGTISRNSNAQDRIKAISKYLDTLLKYIQKITKEEEEKQLTLLGSGADIKWLRFFQLIINKKHPEYEPFELIDWKERQNEELQARGRKLGVEIEKFMKKTILSKLFELYGKKWDLEIGSIKRECVSRALEEDEKNHKEGLEVEVTDWKDMFNINDYKTIITKHWGKMPENYPKGQKFDTMQNIFSVDIGEGIKTQKNGLKWISRFNSYRNLWAHEGTKEKRLNKEEVQFLELVHNHFHK
jgi:DNA sulfur modification protein DndB